MLELENICYIVDEKKIIDNVNIKIENNEFIVITGQNGSGKSTLAKIIMGIIKPTSGKVIFNGNDITDISVTERARMGITFTFQTPITFKGIKVRDLLCFSRDYYYDDYIGRELLSKVGLNAFDYLDREFNNSLSGGELKRIELAIAIGKGGNLSIFDEPEAGIDLWSFEDLMRVFVNLKRSKKGSCIIITHQERLFDIASRIIVMEKGKIKLIGNKNKIKKELTIIRKEEEDNE